MSLLIAEPSFTPSPVKLAWHWISYPQIGLFFLYINFAISVEISKHYWHLVKGESKDINKCQFILSASVLSFSQELQEMALVRDMLWAADAGNYQNGLETVISTNIFPFSALKITPAILFLLSTLSAPQNVVFWSWWICSPYLNWICSVYRTFSNMFALLSV